MEANLLVDRLVGPKARQVPTPSQRHDGSAQAQVSSVLDLNTRDPEVRKTTCDPRTSRTSFSVDSSVLPFDSSDCSHLFQDRHGRTFNTTNLAYFLPADIAEHDRLNLQHIMMLNYLGGLYPARDIVEQLLKPGQQRTPMVLDIGAGSGAWAIDMAKKFPHCEVIGLDLVPPQLGSREIPGNCQFVIADANVSLCNWINCFDVVHIRSAEGGIHNFESFMYNMARTMRPRGILIMGGGSVRFVNEQGERYRDVNEGEEGFSWLYKYFSAVYSLLSKSGTYAHASSCWHEWAETNPNFKDVVNWNMMMPVGNWGKGASPSERYANELHRQILLHLGKSFAPALICEGYDKRTVEHGINEMEKELNELRLHSLSQWNWTWCRRGENHWVSGSEDQ